MSWPAFDLGESINHAITVITTIGSLLLGGWLTLLLGYRQMRQERLLDRRLLAYEDVLVLLDEYQRALQHIHSVDLLALEHAEGLPQARHDALESERATRTRLYNALKRWELFDGAEVNVHRTRILLRVLLTSETLRHQEKARRPELVRLESISNARSELEGLGESLALEYVKLLDASLHNRLRLHRE